MSFYNFHLIGNENDLNNLTFLNYFDINYIPLNNIPYSYFPASNFPNEAVEAMFAETGFICGKEIVP